MSYTIYKKLGLGALKPMRYLLQLEYGAVEHATRVTENVIIKEEKFIIPKYFVVVDHF